MPFTFLNIVMLGGAAALAIPVLIHLFNRNRYRTINWGAMHLLEPVLRKNRKRVRIEQLILLLVRMAIPVMLALAMAQPVITGWRQLMGSSPSGLTVLLDNSYSMETRGLGKSHFVQARDDTLSVLSNLPRHSEAVVVPMAGQQVALNENAAANISGLAEQVNKLDAGFGTADVSAAIDAAASAMSKMKQPKQDLLLISDFQAINWDATQTAAQVRALQSLANLPVKPSITFLRPGKEVTENIAVESLDFTRVAVGVGQKMQIRANLRNYGNAAYSGLRVYFRADGQERNVSQISLGPHEQNHVLFTCTFDKPGSHVVEVFTDADDPLKADNSCMAAIPVWDRLPVLLIDGAPSVEPLKGETDFLSIALQPFMAGKVPLADLIQTRIVEPQQFSAKSLQNARVVILCNVAQLTSSQTKVLDDYVRTGGSVILFPGDRCDVAWYNSALFNGGNGLLPSTILSLAGSAEPDAPDIHIVTQHSDSAALSFFNDPRNGNLSEGAIKLWYKLDNRPELLKSQNATVLAQLDTGDPFLIEKHYGQGLVLMAAIPADADWSNLPVRKFYLPLMQQLVTYAGSGIYPPRNIEVGQTLVAFLDAADAGAAATITDPMGRKHDVSPVQRGNNAVVEYSHTLAPGLYVLECRGTTLHFVVNTSRRESELASLTTDQINKIAEQVGAKVVTDAQQYITLDRTRRFGRGVWTWCWFVALVLLFGELALQQYFARKR